MIATLVYPSPFCSHGLSSHCDRCVCEWVTPSLRVIVTRWGVIRMLEKLPR